MKNYVSSLCQITVVMYILIRSYRGDVCETVTISTSVSRPTHSLLILCCLNLINLEAILKEEKTIPVAELQNMGQVNEEKEMVKFVFFITNSYSCCFYHGNKIEIFIFKAMKI